MVIQRKWRSHLPAAAFPEKQKTAPSPKPLKLKDGTERKFINDYDTVVMRGYCENDDVRIGFGQVKTQLLPIFSPKKKK